MKLIFIRHGDPDYAKDGLTEKGKVEAKALADMIERYNIDDVYQSPLGRAVETAEYSLKVLGKKVTTCEWLREFPALIDPNLSEEVRRAYSKDQKKQENMKSALFGTSFHPTMEAIPSSLTTTVGETQN